MVATDKPEYKVVGTRPIRPDGADKVTGRAEYGADYHAANLLHGGRAPQPARARQGSEHRHLEGQGPRWCALGHHQR